jgi:hypothetical protein
MIRAGHVTVIGYWLGNMKERGHLKEAGVDEWIVLKFFFKKWDGAWTELVWLSIETDCRLL